MNDYIWGVWDTIDNTLHRNNMTEDEAREWVRSWNEDVLPNAKPNIFVVCRRPIGPWEIPLNNSMFSIIYDS